MYSRKPFVPAVAALALSAMQSPGALAADGEPGETAADVRESARIYVPAKTVERAPPRYPRSELDAGLEAWVKVEYCIDEDGTPQNIAIFDSSATRAFERSALRTVREWQFEPALADGQPVWQSNNRALITFAIDEDRRGASSRTARQFRKLGKLIDAGDLEAADALFHEVIDNERLNLYEQAKLWEQRVRYEAKTGDLRKLDLALHRATANNGSWIEKDSYVALLGVRVRVEAQLTNYPAVFSAFRKLKETAGEDSSLVAELQPSIDRLREYVASDAVLKTPAEIRAEGDCYGCFDSFYFTPVRRNIEFSNISGTLRSIEMRCDRRRFTSEVAEQVGWHIPESWGDCGIYVYGEPGTTFTILSLPDA